MAKIKSVSLCSLNTFFKLKASKECQLVLNSKIKIKNMQNAERLQYSSSADGASEKQKYFKRGLILCFVFVKKTSICYNFSSLGDGLFNLPIPLPANGC